MANPTNELQSRSIKCNPVTFKSTPEEIPNLGMWLYDPNGQNKYM